MRTNSVLFPIVNLFVVLFSLAGGVLLLMLFFIPKLHLVVEHIVLHHSSIFLIMGIGFLSAAFFLMGGLYFIYRGEAIFVKVAPYLCEVEMSIVIGYLQNYFIETFPERNIKVDSIFYNNKKLEIVLLISSMTRKDLRQFLDKSKLGIGKILAEQFQYKNDFILNLLV